MKIFFTIVLSLSLSVTCFAQAQSIESEGNLASSNPIDCVCLDSLSSKHSPADIYPGMLKCLEAENYEWAAQLFALAGVYGLYDTDRVKDKSAHQAIRVLQMEALSGLSESQQESFLKVMSKELKAGSKKLESNCAKIREIGPPSYHPTYMIQHGMSAFTKEGGNGLVEEFDSEKTWEKALNAYLHCE
jgi:hypothetical protein